MPGPNACQTEQLNDKYTQETGLLIYTYERKKNSFWNKIEEKENRGMLTIYQFIE